MNIKITKIDVDLWNEDKQMPTWSKITANVNGVQFTFDLNQETTKRLLATAESCAIESIKALINRKS